ncbi:MAG: hypothetical protein QW279_00225 [Candidatus Jordarchaeaceae archaeon]
MFLNIFATFSILFLMFLLFYEKRVRRVRRSFLENFDFDRFTDMVNCSMGSVTTMLSFSSVILSLWAGFALLANDEIKMVFGEDLFLIIIASALCITFFGATMFSYHLCLFFGSANITPQEELNMRKEIFVIGETFFIFGVIFFLLVMLYSIVTVSTFLSLSVQNLVIAAFITILAITALLAVAGKKLLRLIREFSRF